MILFFVLRVKVVVFGRKRILFWFGLISIRFVMVKIVRVTLSKEKLWSEILVLMIFPLAFWHQKQKIEEQTSTSMMTMALLARTIALNEIWFIWISMRTIHFLVWNRNRLSQVSLVDLFYVRLLNGKICSCSSCLKTSLRKLRLAVKWKASCFVRSRFLFLVPEGKFLFDEDSE